MAKSHRERVGEILNVARDGLAPFVLRQYQARYRGKHLPTMQLTLVNMQGKAPTINRDEDVLQNLDLSNLLNLMDRNWHEAFKDRLGKAERNYLFELRESRNEYAHPTKATSGYSNDNARRVADTAKRLLEAVGATDEAEICADHYRELSRLHYEQQRRNVTKRSKLGHAPRTDINELPPWREVILPHRDVRSGKFAQARFAANMSDVARGKALPEYSDAREFFNRTYLTEGLRDLIVNGYRRLSGEGGDPVVQLQTNFGGGKTHSLIALYHAAGGDIALDNLRDYDELKARLGDLADHRLEARRAVIVGTSFNVSQARDHGDCATRTIWGEIAWQLGGTPAYELVAQNDLEGTNPGADTLVRLFEDYGPALIIIDELVRLTQNVYGLPTPPAAGSFESILSFMQSLTEAVSRSSDALLLLAIPQSEDEIGGEGGHISLDRLEKTIGRTDAVWKPVSAVEGYEIVRRRLFDDVDDHAKRDAVVKTFHDMYRAPQNEGHFPAECEEQRYSELMKQTYPIHPELFVRLYEDWSTLDDFQRTRGVLRMMAEVIHRQWMDDSREPLIMPGSVPLWNRAVRDEIVSNLPDNFAPIVDSDVDGEQSHPFRLDRQSGAVGKHSAARKVARAIFMGSAPSSREQANRGISERQIKLATVQPGNPPGVFSDALHQMTNSLSHFYNDGASYWYDTRPNLNRTAADLAATYEEWQLRDEAIRRLKLENTRQSGFASVNIAPASSGEVADEQSARLVVLQSEQTHTRNDKQSNAMRAVSRILEHRGSSPRYHKNMLVFLAPDDSRWRDLAKTLRDYLAWQKISDEQEERNLDGHQRRTARETARKHDSTANDQLHACWQWLIVPQQDSANEPPYLDADRHQGKEAPILRAWHRLAGSDKLIDDLNAQYLLDLLPAAMWRDVESLDLKRLWDALAQYRYLPRLAGRHVLDACIGDELERMDSQFAYSTGYDAEKNRYNNLKMTGRPTPYYDGHDCLVKRDVALAQIEREKPPEPKPVVVDGGDDLDGRRVIDRDETDPAPLPPKPKTRYFGNVEIDATRALHEIDVIDENVLIWLKSQPKSTVKLTLLIEADAPDGFDESAQRTVNENSRTMGFGDSGFEE